MVPLLTLLLTASPGRATACDDARVGVLSCGSDFQGAVGASFLTATPLDDYGACGVGAQLGLAEETWRIPCAADGPVTLRLRPTACNLDLFVLTDRCDGATACEGASTNASTAVDAVTFQCRAGEVRWAVVERRSTSTNPFATCNAFDPHGYRLSMSCAEVCDDGADNDGDGLVDCLDPDCPACVEACANGRDDDFDGLVDCSDPDCAATPVCCDLDVDGALGAACGGPDCDDLDPAVRPGAPEVVADGIDQDCDGLEACFLDGDLDGAGGPAVVDSLDPRCAVRGVAARGDDCDDGDASVFPGAPEIAGDGVDQDCDGVDPAGLAVVGVTPAAAGVVNDVLVDAAPPYTRIYVVASLSPGSFALPGCGIDLGLAGPVIVGSDVASARGRAVIPAAIPRALAGRTVLLRAVEPRSCLVSPVWTQPIP